MYAIKAIVGSKWAILRTIVVIIAFYVIRRYLRKLFAKIRNAREKAKREAIYQATFSQRGSYSDKEHDKHSSLKDMEAEARKAFIKSVSYDLTLALPAGKSFEGIVKVSFNIEDTSDAIFLDYYGDEILRMYINGKCVDPSRYFYRHHLLISREFQIPNITNTVSVEFRTSYSHNGKGLHFFTDAEDKCSYIYSQFEAFFANRAFPCFDQPNLKAVLKLRLIMDKSWVAISNELPSAPTENVIDELKKIGIPLEIMDIMKDTQCSIWEFKETKLLSTYLYAIIAGNYLCFENPEKKEGIPPMKIYCRKSLAKYMENIFDNMMHISVCGMAFYQKYFNSPYPFGKYDQIFVPEFQSGAMENAGAVTFHENYIFRDKPTDRRMTYFGNTILHEMSHMWFGDLVTMDWWNDLWLNESFATFISHYCMGNAEGLEKYQLNWYLFLGEKNWALREDQLPSTHPILATISNTEEADSIFDGISYGKGACVLKQLMHLVTPECFKDGLQSYFKIYAYQNTTITKFLEEMKKALAKVNSPINLDAWSDQWLQSRGCSVLYPEVQYKDGVIESAKVIQELADNAEDILRIHKIDVALYDEEMNETTVPNIFVSNSKETVVNELVGKRAVAILVNANDHTYAKTLMDNVSLDTIKNKIFKIPNMINKEIAARAFYQLIRDGKVRASEYTTYLYESVKCETDENCVTNLLMLTYMICTNYFNVEDAKAFMAKMFNEGLERMVKANSAPWRKAILLDLTRLASTPEQLKLVIEWAKNGYVSHADTHYKDVQFGFSAKQLVVLLVYAEKSFDLEYKQEVFESIFAGDSSDSISRLRLSCTAVLPSLDKKEELWDWYFSRSKEPYANLQASMEHFMHWDQREIHEKFIDKFIARVADIFTLYESENCSSVFENLCPQVTNKKVLLLYSSWINWPNGKKCP